MIGFMNCIHNKFHFYGQHFSPNLKGSILDECSLCYFEAIVLSRLINYLGLVSANFLPKENEMR